MGYNKTLHLFDTNRFYNETVPTLKGQNGLLEEVYQSFVRKDPRTSLTIDEIAEVANRFDDDFSNIKGQRFYCDTPREEINQFHNKLYEFQTFFEYIIFKECALARPCFHLGKASLPHYFDIKNGTVASKIAWSLDKAFILHSDMEGICGWINAADVQRLLNDTDSFALTEVEQPNFIEFIQFMEIANKNDLGILTAIDHRYRLYREFTPIQLPPGTWNGFPFEYTWKDFN